MFLNDVGGPNRIGPTGRGGGGGGVHQPKPTTKPNPSPRPTGGQTSNGPAKAAELRRAGSKVDQKVATQKTGSASGKKTATQTAKKSGDGSGGGGSKSKSTAEKLQKAANQASAEVGAGKGHEHGSRVHSAFERIVKSLKIPYVETEFSYRLGVKAGRGSSGSVRVDVIQFDSKGNVVKIYDLKTGNATLTPARISKIQRNLPKGSQDVPVTMIKPDP